MKKGIYLLLGLFILASGYYFLSVSFAAKNRAKLQNAYDSYLKGERAKTLGERSDAFNQALSDYLALEEKWDLRFGNGKLFYNLGNTYFQLGQYPYAILYYYKAQALMPRSEKVGNNLKIVQEKLGVKERKTPSLFTPFFQWVALTSLPERIQFFSLMAILAFVLTSVYIWGQGLWFKRGAILFTSLASLTLLSLGYSYYFEPIEGVLIKSTPLYRDAGFQYAKVQQEPLLSGMKVEVLDLVDEGKWAKIATPEGGGGERDREVLGYVPQETIRGIY